MSLNSQQPKNICVFSTIFCVYLNKTKPPTGIISYLAFCYNIFFHVLEAKMCPLKIHIKVLTTTKKKKKMMRGSEMKVAQSCLTLCDPMDYTVHGILQAIILELVASCSRTCLHYFHYGFFKAKSHHYRKIWGC